MRQIIHEIIACGSSSQDSVSHGVSRRPMLVSSKAMTPPIINDTSRRASANDV
ncbi:hypothetical protein OKW45_002479 [Paraburkholderia sp. WSM4175]